MSTRSTTGEIRFLDILDIVAAVLDEHTSEAGPVTDGDVSSRLVVNADLDLDRLMAADRWARRRARELAQISGKAKGTGVDILVYLFGAVLFFALVMASIALHEIGHLVPGKIFDVKTTQYFVGFGRTLWSRRMGETEYGVKAIPLGGYVRFVGMYPPAADHPGQVRAARTGIFQTMADNARAAEWETIRPEDDGRLFYQKKTWQKLIIMAGGPTMNLLLAFAFLFGVTATYGVYRIPVDREPGPGVHRRRRRDRPELRRQAEDPGVPVGYPAGRQGGGLQRSPDRLLGGDVARRSGATWTARPRSPSSATARPCS